MNKVLSNKKIIFFLVMPGMLVFFAAILFPIIISTGFSMTDMQGSPNGASFIGFDNYINLLFHDSTFWLALKNAVILGLATIIIQHPIAISFAIFLDQIGGKMEKIFRVIFFIPCIISTMVTAKMWVNLMNSNFGMLNKLLSAIGLESLQSTWLSSPDTALGSLMFIIIWQGFGWGMLIYYAGIKGIPVELYEAAAIDGAGGIKKHFAITLPLLRPVINVCVTLAIINSLKQMDIVYLTTAGGPGDSTQFLATYLYQQAFSAYKFGYGNTIGIVFIILCLIFSFLSTKIISKNSHQEG